MPYLKHFGLKEHPFTLTPNTQYYYPSEEHTQLIQSVKYAIERHPGVIKVVGDVGTGKTLLCRLLLRKLVGDHNIAFLNAPQGDAQVLKEYVCHELGITLTEPSYAVHALTKFMLEEDSKGRQTILVVDEAQALGVEGLETIRLLSNIETERKKLLTIVLFGQSELDELIARPELRQLAQRITFAFATSPLTLHEAEAYIWHRLRVSAQDNTHPIPFDNSSIQALAKHAHGNPRVINMLSDKSLMIAFGEGAAKVAPAHVSLAVQDSALAIKAILAKEKHTHIAPSAQRRTSRKRVPLWRKVIVAAVSALLTAGIVFVMAFYADDMAMLLRKLANRLSPETAQHYTSPEVSVKLPGEEHNDMALPPLETIELKSAPAPKRATPTVMRTVNATQAAPVVENKALPAPKPVPRVVQQYVPVPKPVVPAPTAKAGQALDQDVVIIGGTSISPPKVTVREILATGGVPPSAADAPIRKDP